MPLNYGRTGGKLDEDSGTVPDHISYSVDITGHEDPFRWEVRRLGPSATIVTPSDCKGESDTYNGAMLDASTKRTEHLFDCPVKADLRSPQGPTDLIES